MKESGVEKKLVGAFSLPYLKDRVSDRVKDIVAEGKTNIPASLSTKMQQYIDDKFPEYSDEFSEIAGKIRNLSVLDLNHKEQLDRFEEEVAKLMQVFLSDRFTLAEFEERINQLRPAVDEDFVLSEVLTAERYKNDETGNEADFVQIHITPAASKGGFEVVQQLVDGFRLLAERVTEHPKYNGVTQIRADSYLVVEHPKMVEKFGFTLDPEDKRVASMSVDTLKTMYGK